MKFTLEMIATALPTLQAAAQREIVPLGPARIGTGPTGQVAHPDYDDSTWDTIQVGDRWGGPGQTHWLRIPVHVPHAWTEGTVAVRVVLGAYQDISGPEALAYLDGVPVQGFDYYHRELILDRGARDGRTLMLALEIYSSLRPGPQVIQALELVRIDPEAEALYHDLRVVHDAVLTMSEDAPERARLIRAMVDAYDALDLRQPQSDDYLRSVLAARTRIREAYRRGPSDAPRTVAVGHAHIDLAWLFPVAQTRRKGARTFSTALTLMEQYPDYHFVASQPALYDMVREDEPALYARIKERIAEGRWEPTGASWVEMDCNLAGGEALVRQFLFGKRYFRQELGVDPKVLWLPDVFGYSAALPQVLTGCDVAYFMTTKISWNEYNRLPYDTFRWAGIDGTEVLTHMVTAPLLPSELSRTTQQPFYTYNAKFTPYDVAGNWAAYRQKDVNEELLYLFGYGDGGGGPTAEMQETARRLRDLPNFVQVEQSSAEAFFARLNERVWDDPNLPRWAGELYLEYHRGTYTSQGWIKRANRKNELLYREAELWSALATLVDPAAAGRQQELTQGWESLLFNQFHDILPGSSIHEVYQDAREDHRAIEARGEGVSAAARATIAHAVENNGPHGTSVVVFNPAPFAREDPVAVTFPADEPLPALADATGRPVSMQEVARDDTGRHALIGASVPSLGYRAYAATTATSTPDDADDADDADALRVTRDALENRFFRLHLDEHAEIVSLYDKRAGREVIAPGEQGNRLIAFEDRPLNFDAWDINIYYQDKPYPVDDVTSWEVVEHGPLRGGVEIVRQYGQSVITQRILLYRDVPRIDFPTHVDWHEHQTLLKASFPVTVNAPRATFDIQWGNVERPTHWNTSWDWARFETCAHKWADLSEGDYGVALLNDCKYGYDIKGQTIRLSLIKSGVYPDPEADQGAHVFSYALAPHPGDWRGGEVVRQAYLFNMPATGYVRPARDMSGANATAPQALPSADSLVATSRPGLVIETIKPAEDGDGVIVRFYDAHNTRGEATLTFARPIASAEETNMLEETHRPAVYDGHDLRVAVRPYGIGTFRVRLVNA
jgi:alpha-mannosidase